MSDQKASFPEVGFRPPRADELPMASALGLRSKAHWGYDKAFMDACCDELTLAREDLLDSELMLAVTARAIVGVAQLSQNESRAELEKLFIEPDWIGRGIGKLLFNWSVEKARYLGAHTISVTADPYAVPFYEKMGFERFGQEASGSIAGRILPVYQLQL